MSYLDNIPVDKLKDYEEIADWQIYYKELCKKKDITIELTNKIFKSEVAFMETYDVDIRFENCYFVKSILLGSCTFNRSLTLYNCFIDDSIVAMIEPIIFNQEFTMLGTYVKKFIITRGVFNSCIWVLSDCELCLLSGGEYKNLELSVWNDGMKEMDIYTKDIKGQITISGGGYSIEKFKISGFSKALTLSIGEMRIDEFKIEQYRNEGGLRLLKIHPISKNSEFKIIDSYLGKTEFNSIDFSKFNLTLIEDTHIVDCTFNNISWPIKLRGAREDFQDSWEAADYVTYCLKSRETYRQLKYAMSKQGDVINEQKFHSHEMRVYDKALTWKNDFWTKLIIKMSYWLSDFGQSVYKPLIGLLIGHFLLFSILIFSDFFENIHFSLRNFSEEAFWNGFNTYFVLISPIRKTGDTVFYGGWILIDIFMRVWSSYMIYNMIRATRRFIK